MIWLAAFLTIGAIGHWILAARQPAEGGLGFMILAVGWTIASVVAWFGVIFGWLLA